MMCLIGIFPAKGVSQTLDSLSTIEMKEVVVKARMHQATLTDLNDHILEWIKKNHLTSKLKIQF